MSESIIKHKNIIYVAEISIIGGVETFVYEMVKKYHKLDIAVVCKRCDPIQAQRIRKYCRLYLFTGQKIECDVAIINHDQSIIPYICENAKIYQTIHADYSHSQYKHPPKDHPRVTSFIGITAINQKVMKEILHTDRVMLSYNPLTIEKSEKPIIIVSPTRLGPGKGKERILELASALDRENVNYLWFIISNDTLYTDSPNIINVKNRLNIAPWLSIADYVSLLSDTEGCSYTLNEALYRNIPIISTPLPYLEEIGVKDGENAYIVEFNCSNVDDVAKKITNIPKFTFKKMEDRYGELFVDSKSHYEEDCKKLIKLKCIKPFSDKFGKFITRGEEFEVEFDRVDNLIQKGYAKEL